MMHDIQVYTLATTYPRSDSYTYVMVVPNVHTPANLSIHHLTNHVNHCMYPLPPLTRANLSLTRSPAVAVTAPTLAATALFLALRYRRLSARSMTIVAMIGTGIAIPSSFGIDIACRPCRWY